MRARSTPAALRSRARGASSPRQAPHPPRPPRPFAPPGRQLPGPVLARHPHVIVLGTNRASGSIHAELERNGVPARRLSAPKEALCAIDATTRAVIVVPPIADASVAHYCRRLRNDSHTLPVFVAFQGDIPSRGVKTLYDCGVEAVFQWPTDKDPLVRTAFRLAGAPPLDKETKSAGSDIALQELIHAHLRTAPTAFGRHLVARVRRRLAFLDGTVDALWKVHLAEQVASQVPGVDEVVSTAVSVTGPVHTDRAITNAIRQVLKHATEVDFSTLAIRVDDGRVILTGTALDRQELQRATDLIQHVRGVREIENLTTVSAGAKKLDRKLVAQLRQALTTHHPTMKVDVTVFGGIAVLTGKVARAATRRELVRFIAGQDGVHRVVDRMRVAAVRR